MKHPLRLIIGILLIIIGLAGLVLPIIPGIPLLFIGMELAGIGFLLPGIVRRFVRRSLHGTSEPAKDQSGVQK